jgi:hypothetical protein
MSYIKDNRYLARFFLQFGYFQTALAILFFQIFLIVGLGKCSALAPDEKSYLQVFEGLYVSGSSNDLNFAGTSTWIYELFFLPGFLLAKMGIEPIYSIRGSAIIHSHIMLALTWKYLKKIPKTFKPPIFLIPLGLSVSLFTFLSLGLRESFLVLNLVFYFTSLELLKRNKLFKGGLLLLTSLVLFANLKFYIYVLIIAGTILSLIVLRNRVRRKTISIVVMLSFLSILVTPSAELRIANDLVGKGGFRFNIGDLKLFEFNFDKYFGSNNSSESVTQAAFRECQKNESLGFLKPLIVGAFNLENVSADQGENVSADQGENVSADQGENVSADQGENVSADQGENVSATDFYAFDKPRELIVLGHLPFNLVNFIVGPIPGTSAGVSYFGLLDSFMWLFFFIFIALTLFGKTRFHLVFDQIVTFAMSFSLAFTLFSAAIEVNSGTSFRHRILLFIPLLIILSRLRPRKTPSNSRTPSGSA